MIIRNSLTHEKLKISVEVTLTGRIEFLCERRKIIGFCSCRPIDAESGALRHDGMQPVMNEVCSSRQTISRSFSPARFRKYPRVATSPNGSNVTTWLRAGISPEVVPFPPG